MANEVSLQELADERKQGKAQFLLDVREPDELEISKLSEVYAIPMAEVPDRLAEIPRDQDVVVICRSGGRSGKITDFLLDNGYTRVRNLVGGMNGWATEIDPTLPTY